VLLVGEKGLGPWQTLRADFFGELQKDEPLYKAHRLINVPPLREAELGEVVGRPAKLLSARFEPDHLAADVARRTAEESTRDAGALPLLSMTCGEVWSSNAMAFFVRRRSRSSSVACWWSGRMRSFPVIPIPKRGFGAFSR
jgi:hypothetical protein